MKRYIILIIVALLSNNVGSAQNLDVDTASEFQVYSLALYLTRYLPVDKTDNEQFLLSKKWIQTVHTYINDMDKRERKPDLIYPTMELNIPEINKMGITLQFNSNEHAREWLESDAIQRFIKKMKIDVSYNHQHYYYYNYKDSTYVDFSNNQLINWHAVIMYLQENNPLKVEQYGNVFAYMMDNPIWDKYEPQPCANICSDYFFSVNYDNPNMITFGHKNTNTGWVLSGWTLTYEIDKRAFHSVIIENNKPIMDGF